MWGKIYNHYSFKCTIGGVSTSSSLVNDIHTIAYFYHWTERDILSLSIRKRKNYVELIREQIDRENGEDDDPFGKLEENEEGGL